MSLVGPSGSKKLAEEAAWDFLKDNPDVQFNLATMNPVMVYGPPLLGSGDIKHLGQSASEIYALMNKSSNAVPPTPMPVFVDVRDVALAHRLAYESNEPGRFVLCSGSFNKAQVCQLFRDEMPDIKERVPTVTQKELEGAAHYSVDTTRAEMILNLRFRPLKETFLDMAQALLAMEVRAEI